MRRTAAIRALIIRHGIAFNLPPGPAARARGQANVEADRRPVPSLLRGPSRNSVGRSQVEIVPGRRPDLNRFEEQGTRMGAPGGPRASAAAETPPHPSFRFRQRRSQGRQGQPAAFEAVRPPGSHVGTLAFLPGGRTALRALILITKEAASTATRPSSRAASGAPYEPCETLMDHRRQAVHPDGVTHGSPG